MNFLRLICLCFIIAFGTLLPFFGNTCIACEKPKPQEKNAADKYELKALSQLYWVKTNASLKREGKKSIPCEKGDLLMKIGEKEGMVEAVKVHGSLLSESGNIERKNVLTAKDAFDYFFHEDDLRKKNVSALFTEGQILFYDAILPVEQGVSIKTLSDMGHKAVTEMYDVVIKADYKKDLAYFYLAALDSVADVGRIEHWRQAAQLNPQDPTAQILAANFFVSIKRFDEARKLLKNARKHFPVDKHRIIGFNRFKALLDKLEKQVKEKSVPVVPSKKSTPHQPKVSGDTFEAYDERGRGNGKAL